MIDKNIRYKYGINERTCKSELLKMTKIIICVNDLNTVHPELSKEWNHDKNGDFKPTDVFPGSHKKVWWKCSKGHEWKAAIYSRYSGIGFPYCSGKKVLSGVNDLKTLKPELAKEWHYKLKKHLTSAESVSHVTHQSIYDILSDNSECDRCNRTSKLTEH